MSNLAVKIAVIESEAGWGRKVDDWMVCLSVEDAKKFQVEFNSQNTETKTPSWYMVVEGDPIPFDINENQMNRLRKEKRIWLSDLKNTL